MFKSFRKSLKSKIRQAFYCSLFFNPLFRLFKKSYRLIDLKDFKKLKKKEGEGGDYELILDEIIVRPKKINITTKKSSFEITLGSKYVFPAIYIAQIENVLVNKYTNLIFKESYVIIDGIIQIDKESLVEEYFNYIKIDRKKNTLKWNRRFRINKTITKAAFLLNPLDFNYTHFIADTLPRIKLFCDIKKFKEIPLIISSNLHPNMIEAIKYICKKRPTLTIPENTVLSVENLYVISSSGHSSYECKNINDINSVIKFHPYPLKAIRDFFFAVIKKNCKIKPFMYPQKIYVKRNSTSRKIKNEEEIILLAEKHGYKIFEPEKHPFIEQVMFFYYAKNIISQSGSGLANAIFCRKASLGIFISEYLIKNEYWAKLLKFNECKLTYIQVDGDETLHSDIYVPLPSINKYLVDCK